MNFFLEAKQIQGKGHRKENLENKWQHKSQMTDLTTKMDGEGTHHIPYL